MCNSQREQQQLGTTPLIQKPVRRGLERENYIYVIIYYYYIILLYLCNKRLRERERELLSLLAPRLGRPSVRFTFKR
jgi:hypothetical protein